MISVILLGSGNVSSHLLSAFQTVKNVNVRQVYGRNEMKVARMANGVPHTSSLNNLAEADVYILAISDDHIAEVAAAMPTTTALVVHTSGTQNLTVLDPHSRRGIFYPLQSFTEGTEVDFKQLPICLEARTKNDLELLETLGKSISEHIYILNAEARKKLHLAAVFVNNFTNHLYQIGADICEENELPFEILHPLIVETAQKIKTLSPLEAQTGPAKRIDQQTIDGQIAQLSGSRLALYSLFTELIKKQYE